MIRLAMMLAVVALAACATAPPPAATETAPVAAAAPSVSPVARLLQRAGEANAPTQAEVERAMGRADIARRDGAGAALTYRYEQCALLLLFEADSNNALRLAAAHPSARRAGETAPDLTQCAAEAAQRRS